MQLSESVPCIHDRENRLSHSRALSTAKETGGTDIYDMHSSHLLVWALAISVLTERLVAEEPSATNPAAPSAAKSEVGVSSRDGITTSGADVLMTRNGRTEKVTKELVLPNGLRVKTDGTVILNDGSEITLRASQLLTFEGRILNVPIVESVAPKTTTTLVPVAPAATPAPPATPMPPKPRGPIKAGEGVQK